MTAETVQTAVVNAVAVRCGKRGLCGRHWQLLQLCLTRRCAFSLQRGAFNQVIIVHLPVSSQAVNILDLRFGRHHPDLLLELSWGMLLCASVWHSCVIA